MARDNITRMPRSVEAQDGLPPGSPARPAIFDIERRLRADRPIQQLRARRPSTLDRIADALASPRFALFYAGFASGAFFTLGSAIIAAKVWQ
jgi:hypothetical protein